VGGYVFRDALAATQARGDQVEGVAAVDLGACRTAGRTAVVATDEELTGREAGRVESVEDVADLAGRGVDVVLGAVAVEADRVGAAAESGELAEDTRQRALRGKVREFRKWGRSGAGEDGVSPSDWLGREEQAPGAAKCLVVCRRPGGQRGSAAVVIAEQGAQDDDGNGNGDRRDGDGRQERGKDNPANDQGHDGLLIDGDRRERTPYGRRLGRSVGVRGRRGRAVGVLRQEHGPGLLIYSSRRVSRL
jgi:hypothetical protein